MQKIPDTASIYNGKSIISHSNREPTLSDKRPNINYPVRIHYYKYCNCNRISKVLSVVKLSSREKIIYIIEKLWDDEIYRHHPKYIYLLNQHNIQSKLESIFSETRDNRNKIISYFKKYKWCPITSQEIRNILKKMVSFCLCHSINLAQNICNSGFVIIGKYDILKKLSHCFNKYINSQEFQKILFVKLKNIKHINQRYIDKNLDVFINSPQLAELDTEDYLIIGLRTEYKDLVGKNIYSLPFGKREWYLDEIENSFVCAKRELYEEFNMQFSDKIFQATQKQKIPKYTYSPGFMLYFLYLDISTRIFYHAKSETIYLDM